MYDSGILPIHLNSNTDEQILHYGVGLTCLAQESTPTTDLIETHKWKSGYQQLYKKLCLYKPKAVCFNGKGIYESIFDKKISMGLQSPIKLEDGTKVICYVMPSTSARVKAYTYEQKKKILSNLKNLL
eukprot:TRINITY_DN3066_c0_g1_i1.p1 TRINITY_DN3066_c0_g1~~TRINITY_DN3066_c0_g1_i1.p1  ORF type:complete len:128 (+),score=15.56 TRINITY_DN3066_c0_g1_i1:3-386(+)